MCDFRGFRLLGAVRKLTICSAARNFFAGQINAARRKKARRLGVLTIFKQALAGRKKFFPRLDPGGEDRVK